MAKVLTLKNYFLIDNPAIQVESLQAWLAKQMLHGKASRARTRFLRIIAERAEELDKERLRLLDEYAVKKKVKEKGKDGKEKEVEKIVFLDKDNKETTNKQEAKEYKMRDQEAYQKEYLAYLGEDYVIDVTPATKDAIYGVRDMLINTEQEFSGVMAARYDEWVTAMEVIK